MEANRSPDLARITLQLLALGTLIATSFWIVRPFLVALSWATTIVVATWPVFLHTQASLGGKRAPAVALMTVTLLLILVVPLYFGIATIVEHAMQIENWSQWIATLNVPQPPGWVEAFPVVGTRLAERWQQLAASGPEQWPARLAPYAQTFVVWFVGQVGGIGLLLLQFLLTVIIAAILYSNGERVAEGVERLARRLAGPRGPALLHLAVQAVRGVALGVVVTAILQSSLAGIGVVVADVPFAEILSVVMFILCVAQLGPGLVLLPVVIWVYSARGSVWGTGFLVWAIVCVTFDNFLRPILIRRGADLPLLLIFTGVIGGLIAFGVIGLFIGPVVLAVAYTLLVDWLSDDSSARPTPSRSTLLDLE